MLDYSAKTSKLWLTGGLAVKLRIFLDEVIIEVM